MEKDKQQKMAEIKDRERQTVIVGNGKKGGRKSEKLKSRERACKKKTSEIDKAKPIKK